MDHFVWPMHNKLGLLCTMLRGGAIIVITIGPAKNTVFKTQMEKLRISAKYRAITPIVFQRNITGFH